MKKKIFVGLLVILAIWICTIQLQRHLLGAGKEGLFKIASCYKDDEFGVIYRIKGTAKGKTFASILESAKYPSQYKVGEERHWSSHENSQKLYPIACP